MKILPIKNTQIKSTANAVQEKLQQKMHIEEKYRILMKQFIESAREFNVPMHKIQIHIRALESQKNAEIKAIMH